MSYLVKPATPILNERHSLAHMLAGAWMFPEGGGRIATDFSRLAAHGTVNLSNGFYPGWSPQLMGYVMDFPYGGYINVPNCELYNQDEMSVELLVTFNQLPSVAASIFDIAKVIHSSSPSKSWKLSAGPTDIIALVVEDDTGSSFVTLVQGSSFSINTWYHVIWTLDGAGNVTLYIDTVVEDTDTLGSGKIYKADGVLRFGDDTNYFDGEIAHLQIWGRCLTSDEVAQLFHDGYQAYREPLTKHLFISSEYYTAVSGGGEDLVDPVFLARYAGKQGLDLRNDYGLEEMEWVQESNLNPSMIKGVHGASVTAGALGAKVFGLRGVIRESNAQLCYFRLNRLSAHLKLLDQATFWIWEDRMIYAMGGDLKWNFLPGTGGKAASWTAQILALDPFFSDQAGGEWLTPTIITTIENPYLARNKGTAPTWPIFIVEVGAANGISNFIKITNHTVDPPWMFHLGLPFTLPYHAGGPQEQIIIDGSIREVVWIPAAGASAGKQLNVTGWHNAGDFVWLEGGPENGKWNDLRFQCGGASPSGGSVKMLVRHQWY